MGFWFLLKALLPRHSIAGCITAKLMHHPMLKSKICVTRRLQLSTICMQYKLHKIQAKCLIEKDAALARRFQSLFIAEPSVQDTVSIPSELKSIYELHHGTRVKGPILVRLVWFKYNNLKLYGVWARFSRHSLSRDVTHVALIHKALRILVYW